MFNGIFCEFRFSLPPSFLFRRKEAKENHLRNVYFPLLLTVSPTCSTKRTAHIRAGRFFVASWMCAKTPSVRNIPPQPRCLLFLFFKKRNRSPSFLFRRKEAKENHLPDLLLRFSVQFTQSCCTKRTAHIRAGRFFVSSWMCAKTPSVRKAPSAATSFVSFLQEKKSFPLLFFLEEKKQKKIICGTGFPAAPAAFAGLQHKNGQLACERPFFVPRRMCENVFSTLIILSRYVFCFFSSRKEIVPLLFFLEEKKSSPKRNRTHFSCA